MDVTARQEGAPRLPHPQHCPPWCVDCRHYDDDPPRALMHRGQADAVRLYDDGGDLVDAFVRVAFWDKAPGWIGTDPADLERPYVEVSVPTEREVHLSLNPDQARALAAALIRAAEAADTGQQTPARP